MKFIRHDSTTKILHDCRLVSAYFTITRYSAGISLSTPVGVRDVRVHPRALACSRARARACMYCKREVRDSRPSYVFDGFKHNVMFTLGYIVGRGSDPNENATLCSRIMPPTARESVGLSSVLNRMKTPRI